MDESRSVGQHQPKIVRFVSLNRLVLQGTAGAFAVRAVAAVAGLGMNVLLACVLPVADYGVVALGLSWLAIAATLACFGTDTVSVRYVAQANARADGATIAAVMRWGRSVVLSLGSFAGVTSCVAAWVLFADYTRDQRLALSLILLVTPALALALNRASVLRGVKRVVQAAALEMLFKPVAILVLVTLTAWLAEWSPSVVIVAGAVACAHLAMASTGAFVTRSLAGEDYAIADNQRHAWLAVAKPIALMSCASALISNIDTVLVGYFVSAESAGIYRASAQLANLVSFGLVASNGIVAPLIADLYSRGKRAELARVLRFSVALVSVIGVSGAIAMGVLGPWALGLFGEAYADGYVPLLILLAAQAINAFCGPTGVMMTMTGHQAAAARIFTANAMVSLVLNVLLIQSMGILGAAIANAASVAIWNGWVLVFLVRKVRLNPSVASLVRTKWK